jgi:WD40 repeat protein
MTSDGLRRGFLLTKRASSDDCRWVVRRDDKHSTITVYDFETSEERAIFESDIRVHYPIWFSADGRRLAAIAYSSSTRDSKTAVLINVETGTAETAFSIDKQTGDIAWSRSGSILAATNTTDDIVQIWDMTTGTLRCTCGRQSDLWCVAISPDERIVVTGGEGNKGDKGGGELVIWDAATGQALTRTLHEGTWGITALAFTPDGKLIVGDGDGFVSIRKIPERVLAQATP